MVLVTSCATPQTEITPVLISINLIDQTGTSETISSPERLEQYAKVDFLRPQSYQKVLRIYSRDDVGNMQAYITSYHPNGQPHQYLEVINGRAFGTYLEWYEDGTQKISAEVIGGEADLTTAAEQTWLFNGTSKAWDECGSLQAEIDYDKGELCGDSIYYHCNGKIWKKITYFRGKIHGLFEIYLDNGALFQTTTYRDGVIIGPSYRYWDDQSVAAEEFYVNGKLSTGKYFNLQGNCISEIENGEGLRAIFGKENLVELQEYKQGIQEGLVKTFSRNGALAKTYKIKNGFKHGEETNFYEVFSSTHQPKPKIQIMWYEGKMQGLVKTWYTNGFPESQREMSENTKNGHSTAWYLDGSLMLIEEYDHDKLVKGEYYKKGEKHPVTEVANGKGVVTIFDADGTLIRKINYNRGHPENF
jgi:antitoxin component YwqK of YwqJK toxin-antitoxin module